MPFGHRSALRRRSPQLLVRRLQFSSCPPIDSQTCRHRCAAEYRITYRMVCIIYNLPAGRISVVSKMLEQIKSTTPLNHRTPISWPPPLRSPTEASPQRQYRPIVQSPQEHVAAPRTVQDRNFSKYE